MSQGMQRSGVPWCDYRWNPVVGCSPASEGCDRCYARSMARRFGWPWGYPQYFPSRLEQPLHTAKPGRVFVCSTSDLFHPEDDEYWNHERSTEALKDIWSVMALCQQHTFLILTADIWINMLALYCRRISVAFFDKRPMPGVTREWPAERKSA